MGAFTLPDHAPELTDGTITLTELRSGDAQRMYETDADPDTGRFFGFDPANAHAFRCATHVAVTHHWWRERSRAAFAVRDHTGAYCGHVELRADGDNGEVSYSTHPAVRGRGHATRALALLCAFAFECGAKRLQLRAIPANVGSCRLAERAGFTCEGVLRDGSVGVDGDREDYVLYSLLPGDVTNTPG